MVLKVDFVKVSLSQNCQGVNMSKTVTNLKFLCNMFFLGIRGEACCYLFV